MPSTTYISKPRVLIVDGPGATRQAMVHCLEEAGYDVKAVSGGHNATALTQHWLPHVVLLDASPPDMAAMEVERAFRAVDPLIQLVLVVGETDNAATEIVHTLDIQGVYDRSDGAMRLLIAVEAAFKAYRRDIQILRQADALRHILDASTTLHQLQPLDQLACRSLLAMSRLLSLTTSTALPRWPCVLIYASPEGAFELIESQGWPARLRRYHDLSPLDRDLIFDAIETRRFVRHDKGIAIPLLGAQRVLGALFFHLPSSLQLAEEYLLLLAQQIALAFENIQLYDMATRDSLTGLFARSHIQQRLIEWLKQSVHEQQPLGVLFIDLDRLKPVNDTFGHNTGDALLAHVGAAIHDTLRESDIAGRVGGDEFLVILPATHSADTQHIAERIRAAIAAVRIDVGAHHVTTTASVGAGALDPLPPFPWMNQRAHIGAWSKLYRALIHHVDTASYQAKDRGGDRVCYLNTSTELHQHLLSLAEQLEHTLGHFSAMES